MGPGPFSLCAFPSGLLGLNLEGLFDFEVVITTDVLVAMGGGGVTGDAVVGVGSCVAASVAASELFIWRLK
jgi:hypothetical protein